MHSYWGGSQAIKAPGTRAREQVGRGRLFICKRLRRRSRPAGRPSRAGSVGGRQRARAATIIRWPFVIRPRYTPAQRRARPQGRPATTQQRPIGERSGHGGRWRRLAGGGVGGPAQSVACGAGVSIGSLGPQQQQAGACIWPAAAASDSDTPGRQQHQREGPAGDGGQRRRQRRRQQEAGSVGGSIVFHGSAEGSILDL